MTLRTRLIALGVVMGTAVAITAGSTAATADGGDFGGARNIVSERLSGYEEVPLALSTTGSGHFRAKIDASGQTISYRLSYTNLEGDVTMAHIHFGSPSQAGGISTFLCAVEGGPEGTPTCPSGTATVTGTITPEDIIGPAEQGIEAGEFDELIDAIRAGVTYINVHSTKYPAGELRGHIEARR